MGFSFQLIKVRVKMATLVVSASVALAGAAPLAQAQTSSADTSALVQHNTWSLGTHMPTPRMGAFTGVIGSKVYVIGGENNSTVLSVNEIYDTATNKWETTDGAPMPTPRWVGASAVVNGILYAIGGENSNNSPLRSVEAYNPKINKWETLPKAPFAHDSMYATVEKGLIYIIGGYNSQRLSAVWTYNPVNGEWKRVASLKVGKSLSSVGLLGSTIIAAGGLSNDGVTDDNEGYNATTNKWKTLDPMPTASEGACFEASKDLFYVAGGFGIGGPGDVLKVLEAYSLKANSWRTNGLVPMKHPVVNAGSADVEGRLYCFGGSNNGNPFLGTIYNYVQIYQP
jgi:N-acetylneuraminic acid mutarotase